jgi:hypothetical protein
MSQYEDDADKFAEGLDEEWEDDSICLNRDCQHPFCPEHSDEEDHGQ